jgi:hypothetical protein
MDTIKIGPETWAQALPVMLMLNEHGVKEVRKEFERMAFLADQFGKPLNIEVYGMAGETISDNPEYWDILVRCDGEDPIEEYKNLPTFAEAWSIIEKLIMKYPGANYDEI